VTVGWEAYGELNEARDNAILITHFFSGTSHAAGRYGADGEPPTEGLKEALKLVTLNANHWQWANEAFNRDWADDARAPAQDITARYAIEQTLDDIAAARAALSDANHLLYLVRANQTFMAGYGDSLEAGLAAIEAPTLMLYSENDLVFAPEGVRRTAELIEADGTEVTLETLEGNRGHLDGVVAIEQASDTLRAFLE
jgi:homoserine O-acetyltransferase